MTMTDIIDPLSEADILVRDINPLCDEVEKNFIGIGPLEPIDQLAFCERMLEVAQRMKRFAEISITEMRERSTALQRQLKFRKILQETQS
jgi:hypothetical protein